MPVYHFKHYARANVVLVRAAVLLQMLLFKTDFMLSWCSTSHQQLRSYTTISPSSNVNSSFVLFIIEDGLLGFFGKRDTLTRGFNPLLYYTRYSGTFVYGILE